MKAYKLINNAGGWLLFVIASIVYIMTAEPTASFWDCGEYIATSFKLQVGHPPGAPTFQILGRLFSMLAFGNTENVAFMVNMLSAISSGLTIMFLFWTITLLAKKVVLKGKNEEISLYQKLCIFGAAAVGALAYAFSDTFWFSAVEGEVYALSSFFTAVTFWAALKWDEQADSPRANRWMLFIAYLVGLSIGVHLLNLLALPAIVYIVYFKKYKFSYKGFFAAGILGFILLGLILYILIPGVVILAGQFELFFINSLRFPFNSGTIIYLTLLIGGLAWGIYYSTKRNKLIFNLALKSFMLLLIGYSTYFLLIIRSNAETPIDENNPSNAINLLAYLQREQYGDTPLIYGPYYSAPLSREKWGDRNPVYMKDTEQKKYVIIDKREGTKPKYVKDFCTVFPRMWSSSEGHHITGYENWGKVKGTMVAHNNGYDSQMIKKPTFGENLRFFFSYQLGHMYLRYFMWNFAGRQNDIQGHGNLTDGNWISGIKFIDNRLGPQELYPENMKSNPARNRYYMLPLLLGLGGLFYHLMVRKKDAFVVGILFVMTGLAIVIYLNQTPYQPRERDYAYAASFYAFAIWIGLGVLGLNHFIRKYLKQGLASVLIAIMLSTVAVPYIMAKENWDDHDRSERYTAREIARNYLDSCEPNAILFTNGDNDTFPLWYIQEVEGYRTDVRVVNLSLLNTDWYINSMKRNVYHDGLPVPFSLQEHQYQSGSYDVVYLLGKDTSEYVNVKDLFNMIHTQPERLKLVNQGRSFDFFPTQNFRIPVDSAKVVQNGTVSPEDADLIVDNLDWTINRTALYKNGVMLLDLLAHNNWERPVYFAITTGDDAYFGLQEYFQLEGLTYRLVPIKTEGQRQGFTGRLHTEKMYQKMVHDFQWGNLGNPGVYLDETNRRMCMNFRNNFSRLADQLMIEGDTIRAAETLDKAMELMPDETVPFNYFVMPIAESYYKAGLAEKADQILLRLLQIQEENLKFFFAFKGGMARKIAEDKEQALAITSRIMQVAEFYKREELATQAGAVFQNYYQIWLGTQ
jgi:hypothetical protein